ncbi:hypothetical protein [Microvirga massiliensis]|uniref:hypothetical protein n=1 Tax=Microvirga massiliensis TaxID=1033741 RepID=UPI00062B8B8A|nr:hypothetical protein [Microvirga massiliensis]
MSIVAWERQLACAMEHELWREAHQPDGSQGDPIPYLIGKVAYVVRTATTLEPCRALLVYNTRLDSPQLFHHPFTGDPVSNPSANSKP